MITTLIIIQIIQAIALGILSKNINHLADEPIINMQHKMELVKELSDIEDRLMILELKIKELQKEQEND